MPEVVKVAIGTPNENTVPWEAYENHLDMALYLGVKQGIGYAKQDSPRYEFFLYSVGRMFTPMARERLCQEANGLGADFIVMMDNDMLYPRDMVFNLMRHNVDIVAPLAFTRASPHMPVCYTFEDGYNGKDKGDYYKFRSILNYPKNALMRCDAVGFGAVCLKRSVLVGMPEPWFTKKSQTGEDIHFCLDARRYGFKTYMDTSIKTAHLGNAPMIDETYYKKDWEDRKISIEQQMGPYRKYGYVHLEGESSPWVSVMA